MSAKEMFEKLGYELIQDDMNWKVYAINNGKWYKFEISFFKQDKSIRLSTCEVVFGHTLNIRELKAINKQIEELGWE